MAVDPHLIQASDEFVQWFNVYALPLWSTQGIDSATGASYERFLANGEVDRQVNPRVRVQARQIFTFCRGQQLGWMQADKVVAGLVNFAHRYGKLPEEQGYGHLLSPAYEMIEAQLDLYNHAFWLLACAARLQTFGDEQALAEADQLIAMLDKNFGCVGGGWLEGNYAAPARRQNPHMHLFEAFMSLYEVSQDAKWLARAGEVFGLFETRFFDAKYGVLREFFDDSWAVFASAEGDIIEPGHMMEWVWLLRWYQRLTGRRVDTYADVLFQTALRIGLTPSGLLYDGVSPQGEIIHGSQRCWPVIEMVKAGIVQARAGHKEAEAIAARSLRLLLDMYLQSPVPGLYIDQRDQQGEVKMDVAPASTLYHLIVAAEEVQRYVSEYR